MDQLFDRLRVALEGRYALERELGAGGLATVDLARVFDIGQLDTDGAPLPWFVMPSSGGSRCATGASERARLYGCCSRLWDKAEVRSRLGEAREALRRLTAEPGP